MTSIRTLLSRAVLLSLGCGVIAAASLSVDLSKYRAFEFGTDVATVAKQTGATASKATSVHLRPALIQQLDWRPQSLGASSRPESASEVVFSFYNGELFRILISYDRYETEGLTAGDLIDAISSTYGIAEKPAAAVKSTAGHYGDQEETIARWQDPLYRFDLIRSLYGPSFRLVGVSKRLETLEQAAIVEATRLDAQEAPQRDAARVAGEEQAARSALEKARLVNKPKFRP